jgi:ClpP class serine protease
MTTAKFTNKEEYLQYRREWKAEYKQLSQTIREKKWLHKEFSRMWNKAMIAHGHPDTHWNNNIKSGRFWEYLDVMQKENPQYVELKKKYTNDRKWVELYSKQATQMIEELKEAKLEAQRQYLASKEQLVTA